MKQPLHVLFLGPLRVALQTDTCNVAFPPDGSQDLFWDQLLQRFPDLESHRFSIRLARNGDFLCPADSLQPGDEVAMIPPVSGG